MGVREVLDGLLETTIVLSFTDIGPTVRRRLFDWTPLDDLPMGGRVVLITGATSGLGLAAASQLARQGASVRITARTQAKADRALAAIEAATADPAAPSVPDVDAYLADLSDLTSVRALVDQVRAREERLDVLINNAGALLAERKESAQGVEMTFATMVLGPFVLVDGLLPLLEATAADTAGRSRIITVTSGGMYTQRLRLDDLQMLDEPYRGTVAYARAKRGQVALTEAWARRERASGVVAHAMHPGWAATPGIEGALPGFSGLLGSRLRTAGEGVDTMVWLASAAEPERSTGRLWLDRRPRSTAYLPGTRADGEQIEALWRACETLAAGTEGP